MIEDIRKLRKAKPFAPFTIHTAEGGVLSVPTVDHVAIPPVGDRVFVFSDNGDYSVLSLSLIARIKVDRGEPVP